MTKAEIEQAVMADYREKLGRVIYPSMVCLYGEFSSFDMSLGYSVPMRVIHSSEDDLLHWFDDYCDPIWCLEFVDEEDRAALGREVGVADLSSPWMQAPSYNTGEGGCSDNLDYAADLKIDHRP